MFTREPENLNVLNEIKAQTYADLLSFSLKNAGLYMLNTEGDGAGNNEDDATNNNRSAASIAIERRMELELMKC